MKHDRRKSRFAGALAGAVGVLALLAAAGLVVVYTGAINVAATEEHTALTRWAFDTSFHSAVERRAPEPAGASPPSPADLAEAAGAYKSMCEHCHAGPGAERADWAAGMRPLPPRLTEAAAHWELGEVFWIVKHGVKMTGMPAFGPTHDDAELWRLAAFVRELPAMTPERYASLGAADAHGHGGGGHGGAAQGSGGNDHAGNAHGHGPR